MRACSIRDAIYLTLLALAVSCQSEPKATPLAASSEAECSSLSGEPLFRPAKDAAAEQEDAARVAAALADHRAAPDDADRLIWYGRMLGNAGHFRDALATFEQGAKQHPQDARMFRHLGHRQVTLRRFQDAVHTLEHAASLAADQQDELEPPTKVGGAALDTVHQNIYYHLGLACLFTDDAARAETAFERCLSMARNADSKCSATHWLWVALSRQGKRAPAAALLQQIPPELTVQEYAAYRNLCALYRGELDGQRYFDNLDPASVDFATFGFGLANWYLVNGQRERGHALLQRVAQAEMWAAFGRIASEAALKRAS